jgi:alanine dehydrogenase
MTESIVLFAQSIVVLTFVYLTAIFIGAEVYFLDKRKGGYWTVASIVCALATFIVLWYFALPVALEGVYRELTSMSQSVDIVVGSVLVPGDKAPHLITKDMLKLMEPGTVLVDVAIDQGGCFETSHPTTHSDPTYMVDGIVHYAVANIPGAVPNTSTTALTNATLKYALALADKGWRKACKEDKALYRGLNIVNGKVVFKAVADVFGLEYEEMIL